MVRSLRLNTLQIWLRFENNMADSILRPISTHSGTNIYNRFSLELFHRERSLQKDLQCT